MCSNGCDLLRQKFVMSGVSTEPIESLLWFPGKIFNHFYLLIKKPFVSSKWRKHLLFWALILKTLNKTLHSQLSSVGQKERPSLGQNQWRIPDDSASISADPYQLGLVSSSPSGKPYLTNHIRKALPSQLCFTVWMRSQLQFILLESLPFPVHF